MTRKRETSSDEPSSPEPEKKQKVAETVAIEDDLFVRAEDLIQNKESNDMESSVPIKTKRVVRRKTKPEMSIALPGSILHNVKNLQFKTLLASSVARYCAIFKISEIVIFEDHDTGNGNVGSTQESCKLLKKFLEFQAIPQYIRKSLFPLEADLQWSAVLHPLGTPHHMMFNDVSQYRDGITLQKRSLDGFTLANCGTGKDIVLDRKLKPDLCVTVKFSGDNFERGKVVPRKEPVSNGIYWGYQVRIADSLNEVFRPQNKNKYDLVIGTSDRGDFLNSVHLPECKSVLVVIGGVQGLEFAFEHAEKDTLSSDRQFDFYLNCCPGQGTRTIRAEEALPIVLSGLNEQLQFM